MQKDMPKASERKSYLKYHILVQSAQSCSMAKPAKSLEPKILLILAVRSFEQEGSSGFGSKRNF